MIRPPHVMSFSQASENICTVCTARQALISTLR